MKPYVIVISPNCFSIGSSSCSQSHMAPPANLVPRLMGDLFAWLKLSDDHALIKSCVFHYEFEFIHPFVDGNGIMGRLWQTLILMQYHETFTYLPVESLISVHQTEYYKAIAESTKNSNIVAFIEFMLAMIEKALRELHQSNDLILDGNVENNSPQVSPQVAPQVNEQVAMLLKVMLEEKRKNQVSRFKREALQQLLGLSDKKSFTLRYLKPALKEGLIEMTIPDKPTSRLQQYRLTVLGEMGS